MKKKKLLQIPPIPLRGNSKKFYRLAADMFDIDGERHLVLDVYESRRDVGERGYDYIFRAAYTAHDWALYRPGTEMWSRGSIVGPYGDPVYDECDMVSGPGIPARASWNNTAVDEESERHFEAFWNQFGESVWTVEGWQAILRSLERNIKSERERKNYKSRSEKLRQRIADIPDIPGDFADWGDLAVFHRTEFVYYKRHGRWADCTCSKCGNSYRILTKRSESYEGQFECVHPVPRNAEMTECLSCGTRAVYKPTGRCTEHIYGQKNWAYLIQPFRESGAVVRYFDMHKEWAIGKPSKVSWIEVGRTFFDAGRVKTDWHLYDHMEGCAKWCDHNVGGMGNISMSAGWVYNRNTHDWEKSRVLRYSGLKEYIRLADTTIRPARYLEAAERWPLEKLSKMGLTNLVDVLVENRLAKNDRWLKEKYSNKAERILGIYPSRLSLLREHRGNVELMFILQAEKEATEEANRGRRKGTGKWTESQIAKLHNINADKESILKALSCMTLQKFLNRIEKYIGTEIPGDMGAWGCGRMAERCCETARIYMDYINMRVDGGYGMGRSSDQAPRDLFGAHNLMVLAAEKDKTAKRIKETREKYPGIKRRYRSLKKRYAWQHEGLSIRPAKDPGEIIEEGQILHHCVGRNDLYISKHDRGETYILFLRDIKNPNNPYITVEIGDDDRIRQWYGRNDSKPDEKANAAWLEGWLREVKARKENRDEFVFMAKPVSEKTAADHVFIAAG